jgi:hypothetical protein
MYFNLFCKFVIICVYLMNLKFCSKFALLTQYCAGDKIEQNEMGGACRAYGEDERHIQGFGGET